MADHSQIRYATRRSILVVLPTWVGDFVMATPALRAIRERFRDARITFLSEPNLRELIRGGDWMDEVLEWPERGRRSFLHASYRRLVRTLRAKRFDLAVLLPNSFRAAWIAWLAGARRRLGYNRDGRRFLLTDPIPIRNKRRVGWRPRVGCVPDAPMHDRRPSDPAPDPAGGMPKPEGPAPAGHSGAGMSRLQPVSALHGGARDNVLSPPNADGAGLAMPPAPAPDFIPPKLPVRPGRYAPMRLSTYYADLVEAIHQVWCVGDAPYLHRGVGDAPYLRPGDRFELFTTPDCDAVVEARLAELGTAGHEPLVVFSPGARYGSAKCWMPDRFAALADRLVDELGAAVVITCGPGEEPIARAIGDAGRGGTGEGSGHRNDRSERRAFVFDNPRLSLGELKSLIKRCHLLVCTDAGPRHIAKAFDVPVVTIFGPTHPEWTATDYPKESIVRVDVDCGPCQQRTCPLGHLECMTRITVDMVFDAAVRALGGADASIG